MKTLLAVALLAASSNVAAQPGPPGGRDALVVSAGWLRQHISDPNLVLLHVGNRQTYDAGHIPGARYVDYRSTLASSGSSSGLTLEMLPPGEMHGRLAALGISDDSHVVVYQSDDMWTPSTRVMLTLDHAGLSRVSWLDGGQRGWVTEGGTLSTALPPDRSGKLSPLKIRPVVVDAAFVTAHLKTPAFAIVDARAPAFYDGTRTGGRPPAEHKTGHIAGAVNVPFDSFTSAAVQLKPVSAIAAVFSKAGVKPGDTVIAYCHIGQQATAVIFAARAAGYKVLLYDGSFEDWSRRDLPVESIVIKK